MKKINFNLAKKYIYLFLPFMFTFITIILSSMFSGKNIVISKNDYESVPDSKNEKMISVYFHKTNETRTVELEEYLMGVLPAEMPPSFNEEALKAQAVAARTYIISREGVEDEKHKLATVCTDSTHCKAYLTEDEALERWGNEWTDKYKNKIKSAVNSTLGQIVTYNDEPISAVFHSTSSGMTENSEDVWIEALPYLRSVKSEGEEKSPRYQSQVVIEKSEFKEKIKNASPDIKFIDNEQKWINNIEYNESGSVKYVNILGVNFKGTDIRNIFGLRSANFKIEIKDKVIFNVTGNGHGVGMSQYGANYAAENGYTYDLILKKYYSGVEIKNI